MVFNYPSDTFTNTSRYPYVRTLVLSPWHDTSRATWQSFWSGRTPKGRLLMYKKAGQTESALSPGQAWGSIVSQQTVAQATRFDSSGGVVPAEEIKWNDANNPGDQWMLYSSAGNPIRLSSLNSWMIDPGNANIRARIKSYVLEQLAAQGWDGLFCDNVTVTDGATDGTLRFPDTTALYRRDASNNLVVAYSTLSALSNAWEAMCADVFAAIKAAGYVMIGNVNWSDPGTNGNSNGVLQNNWCQRVARYMTGAVTEFASVEPSTLNSRSTENVVYYDWWTEWVQTVAATTRAQGAEAIHGIGEVSTAQKLRYAIGSTRVTWNGLAPAMESGIFAPAWTAGIHDLVWGAAVGNEMTAGTLRARRWSNRWAVINTDRDTAQTQTFSDPLAGGFRTFTVNPLDAYLGT